MKDANQDRSKVTLQKGRRHTKARAAIFALFERSKHPLAIKDIVNGVTANEASVYRTIRMLESDGVVSSIRYPGGLVRYELSEHHHHIICVDCGYTEHRECYPVEDSPSVASPRFTEMLGHEVTYFGRCIACAR